MEEGDYCLYWVTRGVRMDKQEKITNKMQEVAVDILSELEMFMKQRFQRRLNTIKIFFIALQIHFLSQHVKKFINSNRLI